MAPTVTVKSDRWLSTAVQMKSNTAAYIGWRMKRYGPRLMMESAPGAAATRKAPFGNDRRLHTLRPTAITWRAITGTEAANRLPVAASAAIALMTTMSGAGDVIIAADLRRKLSPDRSVIHGAGRSYVIPALSSDAFMAK